MVRGPSAAEHRWQQRHGSVNTSAGDFSVQNVADREQEVSVVQLQVRSTTWMLWMLLPSVPDSLSPARNMLTALASGSLHHVPPLLMSSPLWKRFARKSHINYMFRHLIHFLHSQGLWQRFCYYVSLQSAALSIRYRLPSQLIGYLNLLHFSACDWLFSLWKLNVLCDIFKATNQFH